MRRYSINPVEAIVKRALREDIGKGDITTNLLIPKGVKTEARIIAKEKGILAGLKVARLVFKTLDKEVRFSSHLRDGDEVYPGEVIAILYGEARALLMGERTALNFLQRLSGIATLTRKFVERCKGTGVKILDTRKTTPGLRSLEKYAVRVGGGKNHRMGLYDMILIKDNHIIMTGGIDKAIKRVRGKRKVEVEVKNLKEFREALRLKVKRIMLDNMGVREVKKAVEIAKGRMKLEVSGGINLKNVRKFAETGVDYISVGALTHSAKALDISMEIEGSTTGIKASAFHNK